MVRIALKKCRREKAKKTEHPRRSKGRQKKYYVEDTINSSTEVERKKIGVGLRDAKKKRDFRPARQKEQEGEAT